jgi:hypothetical protein
MSDKIPLPRYSVWQGVGVAINLASRALEEVRAFIREGGKPGPPGLGFDDYDIKYDGERKVTFTLARNGIPPKAWEINFPMQIYRGVYVENNEYVRGDTVTWGGSLYHCNEPTKDKPGGGSKAWTLAVKRGADGRDRKVME